MALKSLRMGVNDAIDANSRLAGAKLDLLNAELSAAGVLTLTELRRRYSSQYAQILKRGKVRNETEFYMVKNIVDGSSDSLEKGELTLLKRMLADFEQRS